MFYHVTTVMFTILYICKGACFRATHRIDLRETEGDPQGVTGHNEIGVTPLSAHAQTQPH